MSIKGEALSFGRHVKLKDGRSGTVGYLVIDPKRPGERYFREYDAWSEGQIIIDDVEEFLDE